MGFPRGLSGKLARHRNSSIYYMILQGPKQKREGGGLLIPLDRNGRRPLASVAPAARATREAAEARNRKRRSRGSRGAAHRGGRGTASAGFWRTAAGKTAAARALSGGGALAA